MAKPELHLHCACAGGALPSVAAQVQVRLRPFRPEDQPAARRLVLDGLAEHFDRLDAACNPDLDDIAAAYTASGHLFLVAELAGVIVGAGALRLTGAEGQVVRVSVARRFRRLGIGRAIVSALLGAAWAGELRRVWMETNSDWSAAVGLYRCCGFREVDRRDGCIFMAIDPGSEFPMQPKQDGCVERIEAVDS